MGLLSFRSGLTAAGLGDLGEPHFLSDLSLPVGTQRTLRAQAGSWGRVAEAGPGWRRDRPLRRAGTSRARGGGARGSSPGEGVAELAAGGPQLQPQHLPRPDGAGAGAAGPYTPASGCSRGAGGGARVDPEPRRCPSLARVRARRRAGPSLAESARSRSARAAPPLQVRARSRRRKVSGGLPVPAPRACESCTLPAAGLPPRRPPP